MDPIKKYFITSGLRQFLEVLLLTFLLIYLMACSNSKEQTEAFQAEKSMSKDILLPPAEYESNPFYSASTKCEDSPKAQMYLIQPVEGMTSNTFGRIFFHRYVLPNVSESIQQFWQEFGDDDIDIDSQIRVWKVSQTAKNAVIDRREFLEMLNQLRTTIIAFEESRESPERAAGFFAGTWNDWRARHMSRDEFIQGFFKEVSDRTKKGIPIYGAILHAAQAMRNRLDDLYNAAGSRIPPEDNYQMQLWDINLRGKAASVEVEALLNQHDGQRYWNEYLINRMTTIKCVAASLDKKRDTSLAKKIIESQSQIPTIGYANPNLVSAIYNGQIDGINVSEVGLYLAVFLSMYNNSDIAECRSVVSQSTMYRIAGAGSVDVLQQIFGGLVQAHQNKSGSRDDMFEQSFRAGTEAIGGMALSEASARADARLFYNNHGCDSEVADRFFDNITTLAWQK